MAFALLANSWFFVCAFTSSLCSLLIFRVQIRFFILLFIHMLMPGHVVLDDCGTVCGSDCFR